MDETSMTSLLDNKTHGIVGDALKQNIQADARLSILSGLFSVYGYSILKKELERVGALRLLVPSNAGTASPGGDAPFRVAGLAGTDADRRFRNALNLAQTEPLTLYHWVEAAQ